MNTLPSRLIVLMYHGLHDGPHDDGHFDPRYSITAGDFDRQMQRVRDKRGHAWLPDEHFPEMQSPEVMVSFDDGEASDATVALPILQRLGLRAAFFVTSGFLGRRGSMTVAQVRELSDAGMVIGSHGASHRFLSSLDEAQLREELRTSRDALEQITGRRVDLLALPGGRGGERELQVAHELGYQFAFDSTPGDNRRVEGYVQRVAVVRGTSPEAFDQILAWKGPAVRAIEWRHRVLRLPKRLIGDNRYLRLRERLLG